MKNLIFCFATLCFLVSCSGVKKTQEAINTGNYTSAINKALYNLSEDKNKKSNQPYIILLEEAFKKNQERELQQIAFLKKEGNPANYEAIYKSYSNLKHIQQRIAPLLPLYIDNSNRQAHFKFKNHDDNIIAAKQKLTHYLYNNAITLLDNASSKQDYRKAYEDFLYLEEIHPGYSDSKQKMEEAYTKGLDYVNINLINHSEQIIPARLESELLSFSTHGLNNQWTEYHTRAVPGHIYDYIMEVSLKKIDISPEQITEKQIIKEKQIKNGYRYAVNNDGEIIKDSLGNKIKIDKFKTVTCNFYQFTQFKAVAVSGVVNFTESASEQLLNSYPLTTEFVFENVYASYDGDKRALGNNLIALLDQTSVPFPSNEQMVYEAGEDLKSRIKSIATTQRFN